MASDQTRATMDAYLRAIVERGNFAHFFAPDAHPEPVGLLIGDDHAVLEAVFVGTHEAQFAGVPATGRPVRVPYALIYRVQDGLISELRAYLPIAALRAQLTEEPATAGAPAGG